MSASPTKLIFENDVDPVPNNTFTTRQLDAWVVMTQSRYIVLSAAASAAATMCVVGASLLSGTFVPFLPLGFSPFLGSSMGFSSDVPSIRDFRLSLRRDSSSGNLAYSFAKADDFSDVPDLLKSGCSLKKHLSRLMSITLL